MCAAKVTSCIVLFTIFVSMVWGEPPVPQYGTPKTNHRSSYIGGDSGPPEPFSFKYEVKDSASGNDYGHHASSDGRRVQGEYRVLLPDGRVQIVRYTADENGYHPEVQYEGQPKYQQSNRGYHSGSSNGGGHYGY